MRSLLLILISVVLSVAATSLLLQKQDGVAVKETTYARVVRTGVLRCGYAISPPVLIKDPNTGKLSGLSIDILEEIASELDIKVEWTEEVGWGNFIEGLHTGRYDMFCGMLWPDAGRYKNLTLVGPLNYSFLYPYVRADDTRFDDDLSRLNTPEVTMPIIDGDVTAQIVERRFPRAKRLGLPPASTWSEVMESILTKKGDAFLFDTAVIATLPEEKQRAFKQLKMTPFVYGSYFGLSPEDGQLRDMLQFVLDKMIDDGRLSSLVAHYSKDYGAPAPRYEKVGP